MARKPKDAEQPDLFSLFDEEGGGHSEEPDMSEDDEDSDGPDGENSTGEEEEEAEEDYPVGQPRRAAARRAGGTLPAYPGRLQCGGGRGSTVISTAAPTMPAF